MLVTCSLPAPCLVAWRSRTGAPVPDRALIQLVWNRTINPGQVFDLELPLGQAAEGYKTMDQRYAIKSLLRP